MKRTSGRRYVRQMPKIYGNLQEPTRDFSWVRSSLQWLGWLAAVAAFVYAVFLSGWFAIRKVEVEGAHFASGDAIKELVPVGSTIWFFSKDQLVAHIMQDNRIESVDVYKGLPDSVKIVVHERKPALLWVSGDATTVLDENGFAFMQYTSAAFPTPDTELGGFLAAVPRITDTKGLPVAPGKQVASLTFVSFVSGLRVEMATRLPDARIDRMEISDTTYDLMVSTKPGLKVSFNTLGDPGVQVRNLTRLIHQKKATLTSNVDLRIDRWAYVQ